MLYDAPVVRIARPEDYLGVGELIAAAFGQPGEARLVERLRADGDAVFEIVAELCGRLIGHLMLSTMSAPFAALGLAPLSVHPDHQARGVGSALVANALARVRKQNWDAVFVLGSPRYYGRFGFSASLAKGYQSPYAGPHLMMLELTQALPQTGAVGYAPAFQVLS